jgi:arylsulfatase A-like enzyme
MRVYLAFIALAFSLMLNSSFAAQPNVLFIVIDDMNDYPGFMDAYPDALTPNMDALADSGTVFKNAHCSYPLCSPSRASFLSGLKPTTLGFQDHMVYSELRARIEELDATLLHEHFKNDGYKVFGAGKIHHKGVPQDFIDDIGPYIGFGDKEGIVWSEDGTSTDWGVPTYGGSDDNFSDKGVSDFGVARLGEVHTDPFLLMVGFVQPHVPWYAPQPYFDLYTNPSNLTLAPYDPDDFDDISTEAEDRSLESKYPRTSQMITDGERANIVHAYLACISFTDYYVGEVLTALENSPYATNTIVVLFSDHGYHLGEKNTYQKHTLWERSSHVPLIIAGPGIAAAQDVDGPIVSLLDLYPTLIELCGLSENPKIEGRSLVPLLDDPYAEWEHPAVVSFEGNNHAVQTRQFRYLSWSQGSEELYDHFADPNETNNLAGNSGYDATITALRKFLPTNMLSTGFRTKFTVNSGTAANYLTYLYNNAGLLQLYGESVTNATTYVEGMKVSTTTSGSTVTLEVAPADTFGTWRTNNFSIRDQRDLTISGYEADGVLDAYNQSMGIPRSGTVFSGY